LTYRPRPLRRALRPGSFDSSMERPIRIDSRISRITTLSFIKNKHGTKEVPRAGLFLRLLETLSTTQLTCKERRRVVERQDRFGRAPNDGIPDN
jgi:hypothetical protein